MTHNIIWEFRPLPNFFENNKFFLRYNNGMWIPDDGEYDLAFIGTRSLESNFTPGYFESGWPYSIYVDLGRENIICSWFTNHWASRESRHKDENAWHYALKEGTTDWGNSVDWNNPNRKAGDNGQNKMASLKGCSNGHGIRFEPRDEHIKAGLVRNQQTKEIFTWPANMRCMYCNEDPFKYEFSVL